MHVQANIKRSYSLLLCGLSLVVWELCLWKMNTARSSVAVALSKPSHEDFILYPPWPVTEIDSCGSSFVNWTLKFFCGKISIGEGVRGMGALGAHTQNQHNYILPFKWCHGCHFTFVTCVSHTTFNTSAWFTSFSVSLSRVWGKGGGGTLTNHRC